MHIRVVIGYRTAQSHHNESLKKWFSYVCKNQWLMVIYLVLCVSNTQCAAARSESMRALYCSVPAGARPVVG